MSWMDVLIPSLADFKTKAGWSESGDTPPAPGGETQTVQYTYNITAGNVQDITWNTITGGTIKSVVTTFPTGGSLLVLDSNSEPSMCNAIVQAITNAGCSNVSSAWDLNGWGFRYTYNGTEKYFEITVVQGDSYAYPVEASGDYIDVYATRQRYFSGTLNVSNNSTSSMMFDYYSPLSIGSLNTATGQSVTLDTNGYLNDYTINFNPGAETLSVQATEYYYMTLADVTITT